MRILQLIRDEYPTSRPDVAALFGRYLPRLDIYSDLVTQTGGVNQPVVDEWLGGLVRLTRRTGRRARDQLVGFVHGLRMLRGARTRRYDAIQVRDEPFMALPAIWVARWYRIPVFYWMSFPVSEGYVRLAEERGPAIGVVRWLFVAWKGYVGRFLLYRFVLPRCTHVFVQSDRMLEDVAAMGLRRDRMTAVPMGVDLERRIPTKRTAVADERLRGRTVVAYVGSFERFRRLEFLLEVARQLTETFQSLMLLMIGDGTEPGDREHLERRAEELGIVDRILWTGWVNADEAWNWLIQADVAVSFIPRGPLYDCASPTKVVEYLALGIPVVVNDLPDQAQVIAASGAGLCVTMTHADAAAAIAEILSNPELAARMAAAGPPYVAAQRAYSRIASDVAATYRAYVPDVTAR